MGITGTWSGFVADTWTPYNYGSFGPGFGTGNVWVEYASHYGYNHNQGASFEASSIKIWGTNVSGGGTDSVWIYAYFGNINFAPYGTLHVSTSTYGANYNILDTSNNPIAGSSASYSQTEIAINLSNINLTGRIRIDYNTTIDRGQTETFHIYKIWFT